MYHMIQRPPDLTQGDSHERRDLIQWHQGKGGFDGSKDYAQRQVRRRASAGICAVRDGKAAPDVGMPWFWMGLTARRRQKTAAWIGRRRRLGPPLQCGGRVGPVQPSPAGSTLSLSAAQKEELAESSGGSRPRNRWGCALARIDLKRIDRRANVTMHERTVGKQLASLGFRRLSARPQHPSDPDTGGF